MMSRGYSPFSMSRNSRNVASTSSTFGSSPTSMGGTRVYLGGLSYRVNERDIDKFFKGFSGVGDIVIKNGFAFVEFDDHREAEDAIYEMNGKELLGGRVTVEKAKGTPRNSRWPRNGGGAGGGGGGGGGRMQMQRRMNNNNQRNNNNRFGMPSRTKYRLTVMNLSSKVSWQDLKDFMRQAGEVTYADAHKHRKNEGVIEFATHSDMRNALIKLDNKDLCGRRIRLYDENGGGSSRRRSRSPYRSRSRSPNSRSKSRSQSRSRSRSPSQERPGSRSKSRSGSRSRSRTPPRRSSRSESRGRSEERSNRSRSRSPQMQSRNDRESDQE